MGACLPTSMQYEFDAAVNKKQVKRRLMYTARTTFIMVRKSSLVFHFTRQTRRGSGVLRRRIKITASGALRLYGKTTDLIIT